jgi:ribosomal protein S18 acetylase RimI-like enzyme
VIVLAARAQRRGIGSQLIGDLMEDARARGVPIRLSVLFNNPARELYERLGFRVARVEHPRIKMEWES